MASSQRRSPAVQLDSRTATGSDRAGQTRKAADFGSATLPVGLIPRVEWSASQVKFLRESSHVKVVMLDMDAADRLVSRGLDSTCFGPHIRIVTTSTIEDATLTQYRVNREVELVKRFHPAWHVACDRPVYLSDDPKSRRLKIDWAVESFAAFREALVDTSTVPLPLIKGVTGEEWARCIDLYRQAGATAFAYYGAQYFGQGRGRRQAELVDDVRTMISGSGLGYLLLIGVQSPNLLSRFPPQVRAFAGMRWRLGTKPSTGSTSAADARYAEWESAWRRASKARQQVMWEAPT